MINKNQQTIEKFKNKFPTTRLEVDINSVFPNKWNPNVQSKIMFQKLIQSVKVFGFIIPVLVRELEDETYEIIDGEHKWQAAIELKYSKIAIDNLGKVPDSDAKTLTIAINNIKGEDDILKRAKILKSIKDGQLALLPMDIEQMKEEMELLDFDFSKYEGTFVDKDDIKAAEKALEGAIKLEKSLRVLHKESKDVQLRAFIEEYFEWMKMFKVMILK